MNETVVKPGLGYKLAFAFLPHRAKDGRWYWFRRCWVIQRWWCSTSGLSGETITLWFGKIRPSFEQTEDLSAALKFPDEE